MAFDHAISSRMPFWSHTQRTHQGPWSRRRLRSDLTGDDPTAMWIYNFLRTKHFHGVPSASPHAYSLKSRYGKVRCYTPSLAAQTASPLSGEVWIIPSLSAQGN